MLLVLRLRVGAVMLPLALSLGLMAGWTPPLAIAAQGRTASLKLTRAHWGPAQQLPGSVVLNNTPPPPSGQLSGAADVIAMSCSEAGACAAGGYVTPNSGQEVAMVANEVHSVWHTALDVPNIRKLASTNGGSIVKTIACASARSCVAGGWFQRPTGAAQAFMVDETNGVWGKAMVVPNSERLNTSGNASLLTLSCDSPGNCSGGGSYGVREPRGVSCGNNPEEVCSQAFVVSEVDGKWGSALQVPGSRLLNRGNGAEVTSISCAARGDCGVTGTYSVRSSYSNAAFVESEVNGVWKTAIPVPASTDLFWSSASISCAAPGDCAVGGSAEPSRRSGYSLNTRAYVADQVDGHWRRASIVPGNERLLSAGEVGLIAVSCTTPGNCSAVGNAQSPPPSGDRFVFVASEVSGRWRTAVALKFPTRLHALTPQANALSCSTPGNCNVGGFVWTAADHQEAMVATEAHGVWSLAQLLPGSAALNVGGFPHASADAISCSPSGDCSAGGYYTAKSGVWEPLVSDFTP